jgi:uncharacterized membrane protein
MSNSQRHHDADERAHYDTVAATFLGVSSSMVAIIASLLPFLKAQSSLDSTHVLLFAATIMLLMFCTIASVISLLERAHTRLKRISCVVSAFPLITAIAVLLTIVLT